MLLALAESDKRVITSEHFHRALEILQSTEEKMPHALASIGRNPYSAHLMAVNTFVAQFNGKAVHRKKILARFYHQLNSPELDSILSALVSMEKLVLIKGKTNEDRQYRVKT